MIKLTVCKDKVFAYLVLIKRFITMLDNDVCMADEMEELAYELDMFWGDLDDEEKLRVSRELDEMNEDIYELAI